MAGYHTPLPDDCLNVLIDSYLEGIITQIDISNILLTIAKTTLQRDYEIPKLSGVANMWIKNNLPHIAEMRQKGIEKRKQKERLRNSKGVNNNAIEGVNNNAQRKRLVLETNINTNRNINPKGLKREEKEERNAACAAPLSFEKIGIADIEKCAEEIGVPVSYAVEFKRDLDGKGWQYIKRGGATVNVTRRNLKAVLGGFYNQTQRRAEKAKATPNNGMGRNNQPGGVVHNQADYDLSDFCRKRTEGTEGAEGYDLSEFAPKQRSATA